ncbi:MAG: class I SAM-dependent methyltransferase [Acidimicrobiia bacterium]|nr:class I SAM-dependent methyltransferase [Acidimicrobiia bacterium]
MAEVDLEALAAGYEHRKTTPAALARAAAAADAAHLGSGSVAIDVGGGRGLHAGVFAGRGALAVVVDRSEGMSSAAASVPGVEVVVGDAADLPLADGCADLAYFHLSIHYGDWRRSLDEAIRVVRPGGALWVWTFGSDHLRSSFLADWFPSIVPIDEARFPEPGALAAHLAAAGCSAVAVSEAPEVVERTAGEWRAAVEAGFVSTLQMLPPGEVEAGLRRFGEAYPRPGEMLSYRLGYLSVSATGPSLR